MTRNSSAQDNDFDLGGDDGERPAPTPVDWALLVLRAPGRRKILFAAVLVAGLAAVLALYRLRTPIYRVEAKILAQEHQMLPSSFRMGPVDNPARTAWEVVHHRDNLLALIKSAKLPVPSLPAQERRLWNAVVPRPGDPLDDLVTRIDRRLLVTTDEGTITVALDWPHPQQAYALVDGAIQNFLEARHVQEITAIDEVLSVLRVRAANAKDQLDRVTEAVRREAVDGYRSSQSATTPATPQGASDELIRLKSLLDSKERAIEDVEEFRRRRLADLHAQLDEKRATYSEAHPSVIQLTLDIEALAKESPQVVGLQEQAASLRRQYQARLAQETAAPGAGGAAGPGSRSAPRSRDVPVEDDERVRDARTQYQQIFERVNAAEIELDAVRAAFKYRYKVVWPPQVPRDPISPNPVKLLGAGFLAAIVLAFLAATLPDVLSGRIVERWQLERGLGITVLGDLEKR